MSAAISREDRTHMAERNLVAVPNASAIVTENEWSEARKTFVLANYCNDAPPAVAMVFMEEAMRRGLSPEAKQIYLIPRKKNNVVRWTSQTSIDGYRLMADRTRRYAGSDDAVYTFKPDGKTLEKATMTVYKMVEGQRCPFTASAYWDEFNAGENVWTSKPRVMISKCFSSDTEVLTDQGFQRFADVTGRVMQVTDRGVEPTNAHPFRQEYAGPMINLDSDDLNFSVTPNHDMVTTEGKIEAGELFHQARARPHHWIPRLVYGTNPEAPVTDDELTITAAYLCDGYDREGRTFAVSVSRDRKLSTLRGTGGYVSEQQKSVAGDQVEAAGRTITTQKDQATFSYDKRLFSYLCEPGKIIKTDRLISLSRRQARVFIDALISFDGCTQALTGVRRFYTSRLRHLQAFELAAVIAGYAVSVRRERTSDISQKPNYNVTISGRDEIPVVRWGRDYNNLSTGNAEQRTGITTAPNASGSVWCVTVPSGVIVVRRHGFSMLCGNCAEALALRKAFPAELSGIYTDAEMDQADVIDARSTVTEQRPSHAPARPTSAEPRSLAQSSGPAPRNTDGASWNDFWPWAKQHHIKNDEDFVALTGRGTKGMTPQAARDLMEAALEDMARDITADENGEVIDVPGELFGDVEFAKNNPDRHTR
jgi:hypothetical protein